MGATELEENFFDLGWTTSNLAYVFKIEAFIFLHEILIIQSVKHRCLFWYGNYHFLELPFPV